MHDVRFDTMIREASDDMDSHTPQPPPRRLRVLSLCTGIAGLELGLHLASRGRAQPVCYVERDAYAASTLVARMEESPLGEAPIWDDLKTFDGAEWCGLVDVVTAGFPCQPWSHAGQREQLEDERWIWTDIHRIIQEVEPRWVFLENVRGLIPVGLREVLADLAGLGYDAAWDTFRASDVGAPHRRERVFILADSQSAGRVREKQLEDDTPSEQRGRATDADPEGEMVGDTEGIGEEAEQQQGRLHFPGEAGGGHMVDADESGLEGRRPESERANELPSWPPGPENRTAWGRVVEREPSLEPAVCRVADGTPYWLEQSALQGRPDRLRGLGNAVVPQVAAVAWIVLRERLRSVSVRASTLGEFL